MIRPESIDHIDETPIIVQLIESWFHGTYFRRNIIGSILHLYTSLPPLSVVCWNISSFLILLQFRAGTFILMSLSSVVASLASPSASSFPFTPLSLSTHHITTLQSLPTSFPLILSRYVLILFLLIQVVSLL